MTVLYLSYNSNNRRKFLSIPYQSDISSNLLEQARRSIASQSIKLHFKDMMMNYTL